VQKHINGDNTDLKEASVRKLSRRDQ